MARLGDASPMKTLKDLIEFNDRNRESEMPFFGQDFFIKAEQKGPLTEFGYIEARAKCLRLTRTEGIDGRKSVLRGRTARSTETSRSSS